MIASTAVRVYNGEDMTFSLMHPSVCANLRMATRRAQSCRHKGKRGSEQAQSSLHRVRPWRGGDAPGMQERYGFMRTPLAHLSSAPDFSCASRRFRTQHRRSHTTKIPDILCGRVTGTEGSRQRSHTKASHRRFGVRTDAKEASMKRLHGSAGVFGGEPLTPLGPAQLSSRRTPWPRSWLRGPRGGKHAILQQNGLVQFLPGNYTIMVHVCQSTPA